eukprot:1988817-Pyramimonas_sp.AAC.1
MATLSVAEVAQRKVKVAEMFSGMKAKAFSKTDVRLRCGFGSFTTRGHIGKGAEGDVGEAGKQDVRTPVEQDVSIIPTAIRKEVFEKTRDHYQDYTIVAYCTIGYRSGVYVKGLQDKHGCQGVGGLKALNFRGSILDWSLEGYPLVDGKTGKDTKRVHVYGETWNLVGDGYQAEWHKKPLAVVVVWDYFKGWLSRLGQLVSKPLGLLSSMFRRASGP